MDVLVDRNPDIETDAVDGEVRVSASSTFIFAYRPAEEGGLLLSEEKTSGGCDCLDFPLPRMPRSTSMGMSFNESPA